MFNKNIFMKKQTIEKEQDTNMDNEVSKEQEAQSVESQTDTMADAAADDADNVSVEPSLEEQIAAWRDKYLR